MFAHALTSSANPTAVPRTGQHDAARPPRRPSDDAEATFARVLLCEYEFQRPLPDLLGRREGECIR